MNPKLHSNQSGLVPAWEPLVAFATWGAMALGFILLVGVWLPHRTRIQPLKAQVDALVAQISAQSSQRSVSEMHQQISRARAVEAQLRTEMGYWIERRNTFSNSNATPTAHDHQDDGRIDFKIALFTARTNMMALAESRQAQIPTTLGIDETLSTDTRVETARSQLAATVRLVQRVLESDIQFIDRIKPLTPRVKMLQDDTFDRLREYPIALTVRGSFEHCLRLLSLLADPDNGYALQNLSLEKTTHQVDDPALTLHLVVSAGHPLLPQDSINAQQQQQEQQQDSVPPLEAGAQRRLNTKSKQLTNGVGSLNALTNLSMAEGRR